MKGARKNFSSQPSSILIQSFLWIPRSYVVLQVLSPHSLCSTRSPTSFLDVDEDVEDTSIMDDIGDFSKLLHILDQRKNAPDAALPYNADVITVAVSGPLHLPAHRLILAVRFPALGNILRDSHSL